MTRSGRLACSPRTCTQSRSIMAISQDSSRKVCIRLSQCRIDASRNSGIALCSWGKTDHQQILLCKSLPNFLKPIWSERLLSKRSTTCPQHVTTPYQNQFGR